MNNPEGIDNNWVVLKFGGTSVAKVEHWQAIAEIIATRLSEGFKPLVVHSALSGASNVLAELLNKAVNDEEVEELVGVITDQHLGLAADLGLDGVKIFQPFLVELRTLLNEVRSSGHSPFLEARVMSLGELMATNLGVDWLKTHRLFANKTEVHWQDARDLLKTKQQANKPQDIQILNAVCNHEFEQTLHDQLSNIGGVIVTQGFIARNEDGRDVLLGRGGSDTSAAYFAAKLGAKKLEIWTDVAGVFSADPRLVNGAKLLKELRYDEMQELASMGSTIIHPRAIPPARKSGIPIFVRSTLQANIEGTRIADDVAFGAPQVKAISVQRGTVLVSLESFGMWHEVGFLSDVFAVFRDHGLSVDLISTSEANVTITLDADINALTEGTLTQLRQDLEKICRVKIINSTAVVSLVGAKIRALLYEIGPALEVFEEYPIYMVSQSASDLNLSFVVDEGQADQLVKKLHANLISQNQSKLFGPTSQMLSQMRAEENQLATQAIKEKWWIEKRSRLLELASKDSATYVYDTSVIDASLKRLQSLQNVDRVFYAMKSNNYHEVLKCVYEAGLGFECVSPNEVDRIFELFPNIAPERILFTPNFAPKHEYADAFRKNILVTVDNLYPLKQWPEVFNGKQLILRVDPGMRKGHHRHVRTGGKLAKFGIPLENINEAILLATNNNAEVVGVHAHVGSGILDPDNWSRIGQVILKAVESLPSLKYLNLGGGLGVVEHPDDQPLDILALDKTLAELKAARPEVEIWLEPGRYVVAEAGVLLGRVTQVKSKDDLTYVGLTTGMNSLLRPALYGSYHEIVNLTRIEEKPTKLTTIVGPICESADRLGSDRLLPPSVEGDVMLISTVGAYGAVMSSNYNMRTPAREQAL
jgi:diaminopimelate decarboxylase/aspartate kinase